MARKLTVANVKGFFERLKPAEVFTYSQAFLWDDVAALAAKVDVPIVYCGPSTVEYKQYGCFVGRVCGDSPEAARIETLEAALRPFAALCKDWLSNEYASPNDYADGDALLVTDWEVPSEDRDEVTAGMIRAARAALSQDQGAGAEAQGPGTRGKGE